MQTFDVIVVGGSLVGASFALALEAADVTVALVEPHPPQKLAADRSWDSRIYAVSPGNAAWLGELGIWGHLPQERLARVEAMEIFGDQAPGRLVFSAYDAGLRELAWIAENAVLQSELWNALESSAHVRLFSAQCEVLAWGHDSAELLLSGEEDLRARLIVGADGADSWVRECAGITNVVREEYGQLGVVANFTTTHFHEGTAFQWFLGGSVLALLPLPGRHVSMVWSTPDRHARELLALSDGALARKVEEASDSVLGELRLVTRPAAFPLRRQRVSRLVEPRVALIGDAAHSVHPLAGQGMNLGFRDARELARVIADRGVNRDCGDYSLLRRYERGRKEDISALEFTTDGLEKLFSARAVWLAGLRNMGLSFVDAQPILKNWLVQHAVA